MKNDEANIINKITNIMFEPRRSDEDHIYDRLKGLPKFLGAVIAFLFLSLLIRMSEVESALDFPFNIGPTLHNGIDSGIDWVVVNFGWFFDVISDFLKLTIGKLRDFLIWIPWPVFIGIVALLAWRLSSRRVAIGSTIGLLAMASVNLWDPVMITVSILLIAVTVTIAIGIPIGIVAAKNDLADGMIRPVLDAMQTMPSFVYLIPGIMLFGLGNVAAILATFLYAVPPCIRLTNLGIRQVDPSVVEAGRSFGSTSLQLLLKVQIPMAIPTIMAGINQTIMMALGMVVIAAMVGAGGLGIEVLRSMGQLEQGEAFIAGTAIVIMAIIIDRISQGFILQKSKV
jgi:glycine betaine/proline transport system permease protein